ncbi:2'-5'-oligoadenylate synthase-like protein 1 [Monodelphis domestica]|uniref:2'-5'-oligoadenylate synthase-like protein 1 n=1 Tax=Monodelphis domestica TaxID=13616 RepID=UPI0024E1D14F|nr:2'-5'-oligoadenylate synthase-like protein 1 [Monodelphis domestica]
MERSGSLFDTPAERLDAFVAQELLPNKELKDEIDDAYRRAQGFLRDRCFRSPEPRVLKMVKAGSVMTGTMLKYETEVQIVVFLDCFQSYRSEADYPQAMIRLMKDRLQRCWKSLAYSIDDIWLDSDIPGSLVFRIQSRMTSEPISVAILPAYNALGSCRLTEPPPPEIYVDLIKAKGLPGEFSPSFIQLQKSFIKSHPVKLKSLLRLVKHWYLKHLKFHCPKAPLPPIYALELLTIYAWEMGTNSAENFNLSRGFVSVMELLLDYKGICIYWTTYYSFQDQIIGNFVKQQLKKERPVILDPVDPTHNVGEGKRWDLVAQRASQCLKQICCLDKDDYRIPAWDVKRARSIQVTVRRQNQETLTIWVDPYDPIHQVKQQPELACLLMEEHSFLSFQEPGCGEQQQLRSHYCLADYGIFSDVTIWLSGRVTSEIQLFIRFSRSRTYGYSLRSNDFIGKLMRMIEENEGLSPEDHILMFQGQPLQMGFSLEYYGIQEGDTLVISERRVSQASFLRKEQQVRYFF